MGKACRGGDLGDKSQGQPSMGGARSKLWGRVGRYVCICFHLRVWWERAGR